MSILDDIRAYKLADVAAKKAGLPLAEVEAAAGLDSGEDTHFLEWSVNSDQ